MSTREPDLVFDALVEVTGATVGSERGTLNVARKLIKEAMPGVDDEMLAGEVRARAVVYRQMWPGIALTPTALAKHWERIPLEAPKPVVVNAPAQPSDCPDCKGMKMVLVQTRPSKNPRSPFEEYAPCPSCAHGTDVGFWREDGSRFRPMDPGLVRERMQG